LVGRDDLSASAESSGATAPKRSEGGLFVRGRAAETVSKHPQNSFYSLSSAQRRRKLGREARFYWKFPSPRSSPRSFVAGRGRKTSFETASAARPYRFHVPVVFVPDVDRTRWGIEALEMLIRALQAGVSGGGCHEEMNRTRLLKSDAAHLLIGTVTGGSDTWFRINVAGFGWKSK